MELHGKKCIVTSSDAFDICHILPYSMYNTTARKSQVNHSNWQFFSYFSKTKDLINLIENEATLDRYWNLIPLSKTLHSMWGSAKCTFEPRINFNGNAWEVVLKFHWLNRREDGNHDDRIPLDFRTVSCMVRERYPEYPKDGGNVFRDPEGTRLRTGDIIRIQMPNRKDANNMQTVFSAQWVALQIAAMSGAALDPKLPFSDVWSDSDEDINTFGRIEAWHEAVTP